jgi:hypothetical protein
VHALVVGFYCAFGVGAVVTLAALAVMIALLRRRHVERIEEQAGRVGRTRARRGLTDRGDCKQEAPARAGLLRSSPSWRSCWGPAVD